MGARDEDAWLPAFHAGNRAALESCYRDHYDAVERAVAPLVAGCDRETIIHEVFARLLSSRELREGFRGGAFRAWLATVARNHALDFVRRERRLEALDEEELERRAAVESLEQEAEARELVERFRRECLPAPWAPVFEARFLRQLNQREAAQELGISRTTLAYRELRIRGLLKQFLLRAEAA